jgi:hypothetical protein
MVLRFGFVHVELAIPHIKSLGNWKTPAYAGKDCN